MIRTIPLYNSKSTTSLTSPLVTPELPRSMQHAIVAICIESCSGSPSSFTLTPTFQLWHSNTGGSFFENLQNASAPTPANAWEDLSATTNPFLLPDGNWTATDVKAATTSAPLFMTRTIRGGAPWRLKLAWTAVGGTSPSIKFSVTAYVTEHPPAGWNGFEARG